MGADLILDWVEIPEPCTEEAVSKAITLLVGLLDFDDLLGRDHRLPSPHERDKPHARLAANQTPDAIVNVTTLLHRRLRAQ